MQIHTSPPRSTCVFTLLLTFGCTPDVVDAPDLDDTLPSDTDTDPSALDGVVYVTSDGTGAGSSWADALGSVTEALALAAGGDATQVWVAEGTYTPTDGDDRAASFTLIADVTLYGGFAGDEASLDDRTWADHPTILSGEIGDSDYDDNAYHVVTGADDATIDGFTIERGYALLGPGEQITSSVTDFIETENPDAEILRILNGIDVLAGGGMFNLQAAPTVRNCIFQDNHAAKGGAVYNMVARSFPPSGSYDAATFEDVVFRDNTATARGGAVNNDMLTSPTFIDVQFLDNHCDVKGGAIYSDMGCDHVVVNGLFAGNTAERGAAIVHDGSSNGSLAWVTLVDNAATDLGAALYQGTYAGNPNRPTVRQSIVVGNTSAGSPSSISSWHDDSIDLDDASMFEWVDGSETTGDHLADDLSSLGELGWHPDRDTTDWADLFEDATAAAVPDFPYDTTPAAGTGGETWYVTATGDDADDGSSWATAFASPATALALAARGDRVWIGRGTFTPTDDPTDRLASFVLREDVAVYGGFCGGETATAERDISWTDGVPTFDCPTVLSGDIDGDEKTTAGVDSLHVTVSAKGASLDGVIVERGYADGAYQHGRGGGMLADEDGSADLSAVLFRTNTAIEGGALLAYRNNAEDQDSNGVCGDFDQLDLPVIVDSAFVGNSAERGGGAMFRVAVSADVRSTVFRDNVATDRGGALYVDYGGCTELTESTFDNNHATGDGGGVYIDDNASQFPPTTTTFTDTWFTDNSSDGRGGGLWVTDGAEAVVDVSSADAWFSGNTADSGGAIGVGSTGTLSGSSLSDLGVAGSGGVNDAWYQ